MWELEFQSKSVESGVGGVSKFKFVGVLIEFENLKNFSNNIEITIFLGGLAQWGDLAVLDNIV